MKAFNILLSIFLVFTVGSLIYLENMGVVIPMFIMTISAVGGAIAIIVLIYYFLSEFIDS